MSYLVLARKSRPQNFNQVVGQKSVVKTLQNSLVRERVAHAILFSGVRGVGKTTLARIMAKSINCVSEDKSNPCNECKSCKEITKGASMDLYEIDGASNRGIQEIRELKEKIKFLPTSSKYKIIIIDEVHMLTTEAFNALLKTLEEPPEHVHFMFATTELHKIPITILSRCQRYELKRIPANDLYDHFKRLAESESVTLEDGALRQIVKESEGSVRDGLSLLDQVFSYGEKTISTDDVSEVLGIVNREVLLNLTKGLLEGDAQKTLVSLDEIFTFGMDIKRFSADLLDCFRILLLCKIDKDKQLLDLPEDEITTYSDLSSQYNYETIHSKLTLLMKSIEDIRHSSQPRLALETSFLKIIESGNIVSIPSLIQKLDDLIKSGAINNASVPHPGPTPASSIEQKKTKQFAEEQAIDNTQSETLVNLASKPYISSEEAPPLPPEPPNIIDQTHTEPEPTPTKVSTPAVTETPQSAIEQEVPKPEIRPHEREVKKHWTEFTEYVKDRIKWMGIDLTRVDKAIENGTELHLHYNDKHNCAVLKQVDNLRQLTEFVLDFFQKELKVRFITPEEDDEGETNGVDSPNKKRQLLANDPLVIMATETFNGQIGDIRIGPRSR